MKKTGFHELAQGERPYSNFLMGGGSVRHMGVFSTFHWCSPGHCRLWDPCSQWVSLCSVSFGLYTESPSCPLSPIGTSMALPCWWGRSQPGAFSTFHGQGDFKQQWAWCDGAMWKGKHLRDCLTESGGFKGHLCERESTWEQGHKQQSE